MRGRTWRRRAGPRETAMDQTTVAGATLRLEQGDITRVAVDAVVNAANEWLRGGGGVDGAIHRAAGPELARAGGPLAPCPPGEARTTPRPPPPGGRPSPPRTSRGAPPVRHVIHTAGPVWHGGPPPTARPPSWPPA